MPLQAALKEALEFLDRHPSLTQNVFQGALRDLLRPKFDNCDVLRETFSLANEGLVGPFGLPPFLKAGLL